MNSVVDDENKTRSKVNYGHGALHLNKVVTLNSVAILKALNRGSTCWPERVAAIFAASSLVTLQPQTQPPRDLVILEAYNPATLQPQNHRPRSLKIADLPASKSPTSRPQKRRPRGLKIAVLAASKSRPISAQSRLSWSLQPADLAALKSPTSRPKNRQSRNLKIADLAASKSPFLQPQNRGQPCSHKIIDLSAWKSPTSQWTLTQKPNSRPRTRPTSWIINSRFCHLKHCQPRNHCGCISQEPEHHPQISWIPIIWFLNFVPVLCGIFLLSDM